MIPAVLRSGERRTFATPKRGGFLLGAAIGTGMAAKAAERGGASFLLALNAGRFRSMGAPSAACMLALRDSNEMVMQFGCSEILTQTSLPVFFGAGAFGVDDFDALIDEIAAAGFHGVANFPSCVFLDGRYRRFLEESAMGFEREIALLKAARARGLPTLAYVHTAEEASRAAAARVDIVNLDFGWNRGGAVGVQASLELKEAAVLARNIAAQVRAIDSRTRCLIEGGPIVTPEQMDEVCKSARVDGYIGGSTIDRVPLESAVEMATGAFKTIGMLRRQLELLERQLNRTVSADAMAGAGDWPADPDELRAVLRAAAMTARNGVITDRDLRPLLKRRPAARGDRQSFSSEREWIADGLKRNRFRRTDTAHYLGLSRKTLYNKMKRWGLLNAGQ